MCWEPKFFGIKPFCIFKSGVITRAVCGDENASIPTCEPMVMRPAFGAIGKCVQSTSVLFTSKAAIQNNIKSKYKLEKELLPVHNCRNITKKDLALNTLMPDIKVNAQTFDVSVSINDVNNWVEDSTVISKWPTLENGKRVILQAEPLDEAPLAQLYFLY